MSHISARLQSNDEIDIIWKSCLCVALCILIITIYICVRTILHLNCVPKSAVSSDIRCQIQVRHMKAHCTLSVLFATLAVIIIFSKYLVCSQWSCVSTGLQFMYQIPWWDSYIPAKIFLYLLFIFRLFNPHYRRIYQYPKYVQSVLRTLVFVLVTAAIEFNIASAFLIGGFKYPQYIDDICTAVYSISDITISVVTFALFFRPLCQRRMISNQNDLFVIKKYGFLSTLQLIAAISYQSSVLGWLWLEATAASTIVFREFNYICSIIQMLDCLLLVICIYFGFARKQTVCIC